MGLTAYISLYLSILFFLLTWFTPKPPCLYLNHFNLCLQPQEPVYVSLPLDTHPFVFLHYRGSISDRLWALLEGSPSYASTDARYLHMLWFLDGYWIDAGYIHGHCGHVDCHWSWTHSDYRRELLKFDYVDSLITLSTIECVILITYINSDQ